MKTNFVDYKLDIGEGRYLFLDGNSKVTAGNGTFDAPTPNAFSLVSIDDCPYSTPVCRASCYTAGLKKFAPALFEKYQHNSTTMRALLGSGRHRNYFGPCWAELAASEAIAQYARENCSTGFRWHVSGDIFSYAYAQWIALTCNAAPDVPFWIYTRSFAYLGPILDIPNLTVNLSADPDNVARAKDYAERLGLRVCYMATAPDGEVPDWLDPDDVIFPDYAFRGKDGPWWNGLTQIQRRSVCPPDLFGQSESLRCGPCKKCLVK